MLVKYLKGGAQVHLIMLEVVTISGISQYWVASSSIT